MNLPELITPHPLRAERDGVAPTPLLEAAADLGGRNPLEIAEAVTRLVKQTLLYAEPPSEMSGLSLPRDTIDAGWSDPFESLHKHQVTICFGYAALSLMLYRQLAGPNANPAYMLYANTHAFWGITEQRQSGTRLHAFDGLSPYLNGDITQGLSKPYQTVPVPDNPTTRSLALLNSTVFAQNARMSIGDLVRKQTWLTIRDPGQESYYLRMRDEGRDPDHTLVLSIYPENLGVEVLANYATFLSATKENDPLRASTALEAMSGLYPEADARADHLEIRQHISQLCALGEYNQALWSIHHYCSSFAHLKHPQLTALEAALHEDVAKANKRQLVASVAVAGYTAASQDSRDTQSRAAWSKRAEQLKTNFGLWPPPAVAD